MLTGSIIFLGLALLITAGIVWELAVIALIIREDRQCPGPSSNDWAFDDDGQLLPWDQAQAKKVRQLRRERGQP